MSNGAGQQAIAEQEWASVYVIAADNREVKIGYAMAPASRFTTIRREYAPKRGFTDARLVGWIECSHADVLEAYAQRHYRRSWISGEWFALDPERTLAEIGELWGMLAAVYGEPQCRIVRYLSAPIRIPLTAGREL